MRRILSGILLAVMAASAAAGELVPAEVVQIESGDVLWARIEGQTTRVRIAEIDAPELNQPYGDRAAQVLAGAVSGRQVFLQELPNGAEPQPRGTVIARVLVPQHNGLVNDIGYGMVANGHAWAYKDAARYEFFTAERNAKIARVGIWGTTSTVSPWLWRKQHPQN